MPVILYETIILCFLVPVLKTKSSEPQFERHMSGENEFGQDG